MQAKVTVTLELSASDAAWLRALCEADTTGEIDDDIWNDDRRARLFKTLRDTMNASINDMGGSV